MDLKTLQTEVAGWASQNFGDGHPSHPFLGLMEELGELGGVIEFDEQVTPEAQECVSRLVSAQCMLGEISHAVLKGLQGIRGGDTSRVARLLPALRVMCANLRDLLIDYQIPVADPPRDNAAARIDAVGDIMIYLSDWCRRNDIDLNAAVEGTWSAVKQRNWKANPSTGQVSDG